MHPDDKKTWIKIGIVYLLMIVLMGYIIDKVQP